MSAKRGSHLPVSDHSYLVAGLFARLTNALDRNDFVEAATTRDLLERLGYSVHVRIPAGTTNAHEPRHEADGRGVVQ